MATLEELTKIEYEKSKTIVEKRHTSYARGHHRYQNRTGRLTRSIATVRTRPYIKMVARMYYSKFVINGHFPWDPDPFLQNAVDANKDFTKEQFRLAVMRGVRAYNRQNKAKK